MAYANNTTDLRSTGLMALFQGLRASVAKGLQQRAVYNQTTRELQALTNRELADLGIHRSEIPRIAADAALKG